MTPRVRRPYLLLATLLLLLAALFRIWHLGTTPPGLLMDELHNAQLADRMRAGDVAVVYDEVSPGRGGPILRAAGRLCQPDGTRPHLVEAALGVAVAAGAERYLQPDAPPV